MYLNRGILKTEIQPLRQLLRNILYTYAFAQTYAWSMTSENWSLQRKRPFWNSLSSIAVRSFVFFLNNPKAYWLSTVGQFWDIGHSVWARRRRLTQESEMIGATQHYLQQIPGNRDEWATICHKVSVQVINWLVRHLGGEEAYCSTQPTTVYSCGNEPFSRVWLVSKCETFASRVDAYKMANPGVKWTWAWGRSLDEYRAVMRDGQAER